MSRYIIYICRYVCTNKKTNHEYEAKDKNLQPKMLQMSCLYADIGTALHTYALRHCNNEEGVHLYLHVKCHPLKKCINISLYIDTQNVPTNTDRVH